MDRVAFLCLGLFFSLSCSIALIRTVFCRRDSRMYALFPAACTYLLGHLNMYICMQGWLYLRLYLPIINLTVSISHG